MWFSLVVEEDCFTTTADESHSVGWKLLIFSLWSICYIDVYRGESGRCRTLPFFLTYNVTIINGALRCSIPKYFLNKWINNISTHWLMFLWLALLKNFCPWKWWSMNLPSRWPQHCRRSQYLGGVRGQHLLGIKLHKKYALMLHCKRNCVKN